MQIGFYGIIKTRVKNAAQQERGRRMKIAGKKFRAFLPCEERSPGELALWWDLLFLL